MYQAKSLAEFHFDTKRSGVILQSFLADKKVSIKAAATLLGYSYDAMNDTLRGNNKENKLEIVTKICVITGHTLSDWCDRMLEGVNDDLADTVRSAFSLYKAPSPEKKPDMESAILRLLDTQEKTILQYEKHAERMEASHAAERAAYQDHIIRLSEQNQQLCAIIAQMTKEREQCPANP